MDKSLLWNKAEFKRIKPPPSSSLQKTYAKRKKFDITVVYAIKR